MNPYQNKNEYEILNVSPSDINSYERYPLANDPQASMKNKDYKDWMNEYGEITPTPTTLMGAVITSVKLVSGVITLLRSLNSLPETLGALEGLVGLIQDYTGPNLIEHVQQLIQQTLASQYRNAAEGALSGITKAYNQYLGFLRQWQNNRTPENGQRVETAYGIAHGTCLQSLQPNAVLSRRGFETLLLPNFAMGAMFHLLLLRDGVTLRDKWLVRPTGEEDNEDYRILVRAIEQYTNHCTHWYNDGFNRLPRSGNQNDWNRFNDYRRDMTVSVLDFLPTWGVLDPKKYPKAVSIELTRILYTNTASWFNYAANIPFSSIENIGVRNRRATELDSLQISTSFYHEPHWRDRYFWAGNSNHYRDGNVTSFSGQSNERRTILDMRGTDVFSVNMTFHQTSGLSSTRIRYNGVHRAIFSGVNILNNQLRRLTYDVPVDPRDFNTREFVFSFPGESTTIPTANDYTHKLFQVGKLDVSLHNVRQGFFLLAWAHKSLGRVNRLTSNSIAQIPAVKTNSSCGDRAIIPGIGSTGGDLVKLDNVTPGLYYTFKPDNPEASNTRFIVRIRYASVNNNRLDLVINGVPVAGLNVKKTLKNDRLLDDLRYEDFGYATFNGTFTNVENLGIFRNMQNTELVIDKIELIPAHLMLSLEQTQGQNINCKQIYKTYNQDASSIYDKEYNNKHTQKYGFTCNQEYNNYEQNADHNNSNYEKNMDTMYQPSYDNYNPSSDSTYSDTYYQNNNDMYNQEHDSPYNQDCSYKDYHGYNNYDQNSGSTYDHNNDNYKKNTGNTQYNNYNQDYHNN